MRAVTVLPGFAGSVRVDDLAEPGTDEGSVLVETLAVGVCGTDLEIAAGDYGEAPPGQDRLVLGHESVGRVLEAPEGANLVSGDLVVAMVRRPDPVPCASCAVGEWDMCRNGRFTEHGIKALHGFARERFRVDPDRLVKVDPSLGWLGVLIEPASVVAKAWEHIERIAARVHYAPRRILVTGAGPIGLLAALLGAQRGLDVHVVDLVTEGPKPGLVRDLGGTYHSDPVESLNLEADIVVECTGVPSVVVAAMTSTGRNGITCLTGVSGAGRSIPLDVGGLNRELVLENDVVFGSVNANRWHYEQAAAALAGADREWLSRLVSRRVGLDDVGQALCSHPLDVKVLLDFGIAEESRE
jgi:threonine dehydrogenase-like Zn-dependent dehydrogenase